MYAYGQACFAEGRDEMNDDIDGILCYAPFSIDQMGKSDSVVY